jgi:hypothetical protein
MFIATRPTTDAGWPWISARPEFDVCGHIVNNRPAGRPLSSTVA